MKLFAPVLESTADGPAVYVFPYAGATVPSFFTFARDWLEGFSVHCADLPGRMARLTEPPRVDFAPLVRDLAADLTTEVAGRPDRPFALLGVCAGSYLALETARLLRASVAPRPAVIVVVSAVAPDVIPMPPFGVASLPATALWRFLTEHGGISSEMAADPAFRRLSEGVIRADFDLFADYRHEPQPPLDGVPIVALCGAEDPNLRPGQLLGWRRQTTVPIRSRRIPNVGTWPFGQAPGEIGKALRDHL